MVYFCLLGPSKASYNGITCGRWRVGQERERRLGGRQPGPPPLQTGINAKIQKLSPEWWLILIDKFCVFLFAEFELHPSNSFRENRCWRPQRRRKTQRGGLLPLAALIPALVTAGKATAPWNLWCSWLWREKGLAAASRKRGRWNISQRPSKEVDSEMEHCLDVNITW